MTKQYPVVFDLIAFVCTLGHINIIVVISHSFITLTVELSSSKGIGTSTAMRVTITLLRAAKFLIHQINPLQAIVFSFMYPLKCTSKVHEVNVDLSRCYQKIMFLFTCLQV